ncbi:uncharacterized protein LOC125105020 [Lutra lutra]|uniref:uncharacterized protein LOC125105020 n=1 Tax=Lutra lutra TaxID=9657 RepID=UPI001FCFC29D|nr:uncharacterized protein LOC125105020 [Lutra lutra]
MQKYPIGLLSDSPTSEIVRKTPEREGLQIRGKEGSCCETATIWAGCRNLAGLHVSSILIDHGCRRQRKGYEAKSTNATGEPTTSLEDCAPHLLLTATCEIPFHRWRNRGSVRSRSQEPPLSQAQPCQIPAGEPPISTKTRDSQNAVLMRVDWRDITNYEGVLDIQMELCLCSYGLKFSSPAESPEPVTSCFPLSSGWTPHAQQRCMQTLASLSQNSV